MSYICSLDELRTWDPDMVLQFLKEEKISEKIIGKLSDSGLDGEMLLTFKKEHFAEMGLKIAEIVQITKVKDEYLNKRLRKGKAEYMVKLEPIAHLDCKDLIDEYERTHVDDPSGSKTEKKDASGVKRKADDKGKPEKSAKKPDTRPKGFARGLTAEKIIGATNDPGPGELYFLIKSGMGQMRQTWCQPRRPTSRFPRW